MGEQTPPASAQALRQKILQQRLRSRMQAHRATVAPAGIPVADRSRPVPLSPPQQRLWLLDQLGPASAAYCLPTALQLRGALDKVALRAALNRLVARHESLRTHFPCVQGVPAQAFSADDAGLPLIDVDLRGLRDGERRRELERLVAQEAQAPFDLEQGPLIRGQLVQLADHHHVLLITQHHIITDAWSLRLMIGEVASLYATFHSRARDSTPLPAVQYADFAAWQRQWLQGPVLEHQLAFWRQHLEGAPALLELPVDRPRPPLQRHAGASIALVLPERLTQALKALAQAQGCTVFMVLLAGWSVLLARLSGQQEVVIGTPVANRQRPETERILGFFVNTLALRVDLSANPRVNALLAQVKASALAAFAHQELPFEQVVEALQPQRSLSYSPVFQAMLSLDDAPDTSAAALPGLSMEPLATPRTSSHFDLSLALGEKNGVLSGAITYSTDLFDASTVERWSVHLCTLLQDMVEHPGTHIGSLSLLSAGQRQEVVEGFNATAVDDSQDALIHELFQQRAAETPECEAVRMGDQYLSYGDLNARANQLAHDLLERGVLPDQRVAICVERGVDLAVGLLGILKAGAAYVPLDPDYPASRQAYMLQDSQPVALVTQAGLVARLPPSTVPLVVLDWRATGTGLAAQPAHDPLLRRSGLGPRNLAYVIYTSGSTGQPKGVMVEHRSAVNFWRVMTRTTHARCLPGSRIGLNAAFSFDMSLKGILQLLSGHCLMPIPQSIRASGYELVQFLEDNRIDALDTTPSQLEGLLEAGLLEPGGHRPCSVLVGGEPIRAALWERLRASQQVQFHNMYGPTEATIDATIIGIDVAGSTPTLGGPIDNVRIYLLDTLGNPVPIGVAGEIYIAGAGVARGYLDRPALTAERFLADPFSGQKGERMYRTGDLARWRPDGTLVFLGRNDSQVKIRGFRVELGEIEAQLGACPGIREAVVVAREDVPDTVRLVAYVVADPQPVAAELRDALHRQLPEHMIPSAFVHLPSLPLTPNGKLDRQALPLPDADALVSRAFEPPIGPVEQTLATLWSALLGPERIGRNDNFFELGGHSLMVVTLVTRLHEAGLHLPAQAVFATPVLHVLASAVTDVGTEGVSSAVSPILPQAVRITPAQLPLVTLGQNDIDLIAVSVPGGTANIQEVYPLLPLQEGLLFHHLLEEEGDTYLSRDLLAFDSRALLDGFLDALNIVIARHDILRSALRWEGISTPVQVVHRHAPLQMKVLFPASDGCARSALERASDPRRLRLDLRNAPVLAAYGLEDRAKGEWLLALVRHHVVCDHVTLDLALEEVAMVLRGQEKRLGAPRPFREIVVQARQVSVEEHETYFRQELHDIQTPTAPFGVADMLPGGRALIESVEHLEPQLVQRIRACARREGIAPAVLFHVAWAQVLARYTGNDDVVFGTVLSGRLQGVAGAEQILGMTINTLPLRISLGARSVRQLLLETSQRMRGLLAHEHAPLLLAQRCSGVERSQPLFSTLLNFRHSQARILAADTASRALQDGIRSLAVEGDHTSYPLSIRIDDTADTFALTTEWWDGLDGRRIGASLPVALSSLVDALDSAPGTPQFQLEVLGASERQRLLQDFNATDRPYSTHDSIHFLFEAQAAARPQAVALVEGTQVLRYGELNAQANRLAHYLIGQG
ncbi:non-ribosomal peptide synthetase, partial [Xanthomonas arboricola]|uniref:non-ribosomal peptide synthetase n=1 Tax=Xanthomonas arboricola TaxID=56448 RepID=UPI0012D3008E